jgi:hypothetical protein
MQARQGELYIRLKMEKSVLYIHLQFYLDRDKHKRVLDLERQKLSERLILELNNKKLMKNRHAQG